MSRLPALVALLIMPLILLSCAAEPAPDIPELERRVSDVLRLHSYEHVYRDIVYFGEERTFLFFKTMDRRLLFSVDIIVEAGVDLEDGIDILVDENEPGRILVTMPPARILRLDADETTINQYFATERGGEVGWLEYGAEIEAVKDRVRADALDRGILEKADENARSMVRNFFTVSGFEEVVFRPTETPGRDDTELEG